MNTSVRQLIESSDVGHPRPNKGILKTPTNYKLIVFNSPLRAEMRIKFDPSIPQQTTKTAQQLASNQQK